MKGTGITIKLQTVQLVYKARDGKEYILNLIDTPGHVDFTYEVSRSLGLRGALLVVDASQGIEAQTLANLYLALENNLEIVPVINKIDLPSAHPDRVKQEIEDILGIDASDAPLISAKEGTNIEEVLEAVVAKIPPPSGYENAPLKALIFDSYYDSYRGAISYVRVFEGAVKPGMDIKMVSTGKTFEVDQVGIFTPALTPVDELKAGSVGFVAASIKNVRDTRVGDTMTDADNPTDQPLPGYKRMNSMVFCGIYPADGSDYEALREALEKLQLNDASLSFEAETSAALGFGFRCGFLGLLHMEVVQERLEREYDLDIVTTAPSVIYKVKTTSGEEVAIDNPTNLPEANNIEYMKEPIVNASIMVPTEYVGPIMELCQERRGIFKDMKYLEETRVVLEYEMPLNEIIYDFFDVLKSRTRGYASFDYEFKGYQEADLVKLDILLNSEPVDALSFIVHKDKAYARGRAIAEKLKESIPRHMFEVPIQATIGNKIIARETIKALRRTCWQSATAGT